MADLHVEAITSADEFRALDAVWNPLLARTDADTVFLTSEWLTTWWDCFGGANDLLVLLVRRGDTLVAAAPLMVSRERERGRRRTRIRFLANAYSMRANFVLLEEPEPALGAIFAYLQDAGLRWDEMLFNYLPQDCAAHQVTEGACRQHGLRFGFLPSLVSPYVALGGADWDSHLQRLKPSFRKNLRYCERRLLNRESGRVVVYSDADAVDQALRVCREVALTTWQHEQGSSIASSHEVWQFYRRFAEVAAQRGWLRIGVLEVRGEPAAFEFNILYHGTMYNLKVGYRPQLRNLSPGHVLKAHMMQHAIAEGAAEYDMLGMNEDYKMQWATAERNHMCLCVAGPGIGSALSYWLAFVVKPRLRRWRPAMAAKQWLDAHRSRHRAADERWVASR